MNLTQLQDRFLTRVGDNPAGDPSLMHYTLSQATAALNQAQRIMVMLTMCLENTATVSISGGAAFYHMLPLLPDWYLPLRIRNGAGVKLKPNRVQDMAALDNNWPKMIGASERYALLGFDLLGIYKQPSSDTLTCTYARSPDALVNDGDIPEIPTRYHQVLIDAAIVIARIKEGSQEWQKTLPQWDRFMSTATELAQLVRNRNIAQGYDYWPIELQRFDRSRLKKVLAQATR